MYLLPILALLAIFAIIVIYIVVNLKSRDNGQSPHEHDTGQPTNDRYIGSQVKRPGPHVNRSLTIVNPHK